MAKKSSIIQYTISIILLSVLVINDLKAQQSHMDFVQLISSPFKDRNIRLQFFELPLPTQVITQDEQAVAAFHSNEGKRYAAPLDKEMPETYKGKPVYRDSKGAKYIVGSNYKKHFIK